jgi:hypothetical protein
MTISINELNLIVREVRQRVTRMESRICRIADHLNINVRAPKDGFRIQHETADELELSVPMLDIALSELLSYLHKEELDQKTVHVYFGGSQVAMLYPLETRRR